MKSSSIAHPIQGLIKYHGLVDEKLRIPFHDSISVCTSPLETHTTVEFGEFEKNEVVIDGKKVKGVELGRVASVVSAAMNMAGVEKSFRIRSESNFPSNIGLGSSSSGFAALAMACSKALGLELNLSQVSRIARLGSASASRSVTGGFSKLKMGPTDEDSYSYQIASEELQMGIIVALVPAYKRTDDAHREVLSSPFFESRLGEIPRMLAEMELAIREKNVGRICYLAERDTLLLHGITMTGESELFLWRPETVSVILKVRKMREKGIPAFFSIDTGATVYVNTFPERVDEVEEEIKELGVKTIKCSVGGPTRTTDEHLF